jgi:hypothetical protein
MVLSFRFARQRVGKAPIALPVRDIAPDLILASLDHLKQQRDNRVQSRNLRLTESARYQPPDVLTR